MQKEKAILKILKFLGVGLGCALIDFGLSFLLIYLLHMNVELESVVAHVISFGASIVFGYFANTYWVFAKESDEKAYAIFVKYSLISLFNLVWSTIVIVLLVALFLKLRVSDDLNTIQMLAKLAVGIPITLVCYFLYEKYIYIK